MNDWHELKLVNPLWLFRGGSQPLAVIEARSDGTVKQGPARRARARKAPNTPSSQDTDQ